MGEAGAAFWGCDESYLAYDEAAATFSLSMTIRPQWRTWPEAFVEVNELM